MLDFIIELGAVDFTIKDLLHLQTGDVIRLDSKIDEYLTVRVDNRKKFKVKPGTVDGKISVEINKIIDEEVHFVNKGELNG